MSLAMTLPGKKNHATGTNAPKPATGHVYSVVRQSGSSFFLPMQVLPEPRRKAMLTLYAFCREVDDCVDEIADKDEAKKKLDFWREELTNIYSGRVLTHPLATALAGPVEQYHLKRQHFEEMLDGFEMDRSGAMFRPAFNELERYCYRVAGCVGLLSVQIFGCRSEESRKFAVTLGTALQLTNILRDIRADAALGRIYLPRELLAMHGLEEVAAESLTAHPAALDRVCRDLAAKAGASFGMADAYITSADRDRLRPALLMRDVYHYYLRQMLEKGWPWQTGKPPSLSLGKKALLMAKLLRRG